MTNQLQARRSRRQDTRLWRVPVLGVRKVTPRMIRVTAGGPELADFAAVGTDQNVMLYFYPDGTTLPEPLTLESARAIWSQLRPLTRTYTVSRYDGDACEIDFDFVVHGEHGVASSWAQRVRPGEQMIFVGPSPAYQPDPAADGHLLAGDETALPAIAAILRTLPAGVPVQVFLEVHDAGEELALPTRADARVTWLHRDGLPAGANDLLVDAVRGAQLPDGRVQAWMAGERSAVLSVRRHLLDERRLDRTMVRPTTYWRLGETGN